MPHITYVWLINQNIAFYEAYGLKGWTALQKTINYLNINHPEIFTIADAKRGDIGNTSSMYAKAFFEDLAFDSVDRCTLYGERFYRAIFGVYRETHHYAGLNIKYWGL